MGFGVGGSDGGDGGSGAVCVNAQLRRAVDGPVSAAAISFFIGTVALLVAVLLTQEARPTFANLSGAP